MADIPQEFPRGMGCGSGCGCGSKKPPQPTPNVVRATDILGVRKSDTVRMADVGVVRTQDFGDNGGSANAKFTAEQKRRMKEAPGNTAAHRIVKVRRSTQIFLFCLFVLFFFLTTATSQQLGGIPKNLFMSLDFLNTLKNSIASHHVAVYVLGPSIFMLLLTMWGGRIFCGWICPLGTAIDIGDVLLFRKGRLFYTKKRSDTRRFRNWKYIYLLVGLGALVFGVDVLTFGDPISLITRTFTFCIEQPVAYIWNGLLSAFDAAGPTDRKPLEIAWRQPTAAIAQSGEHRLRAAANAADGGKGPYRERPHQPSTFTEGAASPENRNEKHMARTTPTAVVNPISCSSGVWQNANSPNVSKLIPLQVIRVRIVRDRSSSSSRGRVKNSP